MKCFTMINGYCFSAFCMIEIGLVHDFGIFVKLNLVDSIVDEFK